MNNENKRREGFTLIELLGVMAVIGILISLLLPALISAKNKAKRIVCISNERQVGLGLDQYILDTGFYPNYGPFHATDRTVFWDNTILPYVSGNTRVFKCPGLIGYDENQNWGFIQKTNFQWTPYPNRSYGYNAFGTIYDTITSVDSWGLSPSFWNSASPLLRESAVLKPDQMVMLAEYNILYDDDGDGDLHPDVLWGLTLSGYRHNGMVNGMFCDMHIESHQTNYWKNPGNRALWNFDNQIH